MSSSASALSASTAKSSSFSCFFCNNLKLTPEKEELYTKLRQSVGQITRCVFCKKKIPLLALKIENELFYAHKECSEEALKVLAASPRLTEDVISTYKLQKAGKIIHHSKSCNFPLREEGFKMRRSVSCTLKA